MAQGKCFGYRNDALCNPRLLISPGYVALHQKSRKEKFGKRKNEMYFKKENVCWLEHLECAETAHGPNNLRIAARRADVYKIIKLYRKRNELPIP